MYDAAMRTTISLPDELHSVLLSLSRDTGQTMSRTVEGLVRRGLTGGASRSLSRSAKTGLLRIDLGRRITMEDVRALDDE